MGLSATARHIFVSFSWRDKALVEHFMGELESAGVPLWTEYRRIAPGTPQWNDAVRDAIRDSFAVVLAATPNSARSPHVKNELSLARSFARTIVPAWLDGAHWPQSVPTGLANAQFIDCRGRLYIQGASRLAQRLKELVTSSVPKHYLVEPQRGRIDASGSPETAGTPLPPGCIFVALFPGGGESDAPGPQVVMKPGEYGAMQPLVEDLRANYLGDLFKPNTYGADWVLAEDHPYLARVAVAWEWLKHRAGGAHAPGTDWPSKATPAECSLVADTTWRAVPAGNVDVFGLAVNDVRLFYALQAGPEVMRVFRRQSYLANAPAEAIPAGKFKFCLVLCRPQGIVDDWEVRDHVLFQTRVPVPERELEHWMGS